MNDEQFNVPEPQGNGFVKVTVGIFPGKVDSYEVPADATIRDALRAADLLDQASNYQVKMDGETVSLDTPIRANAGIVLSKQVKGNRLFRLIKWCFGIN